MRLYSKWLHFMKIVQEKNTLFLIFISLPFLIFVLLHFPPTIIIKVLHYHRALPMAGWAPRGVRWSHFRYGPRQENWGIWNWFRKAKSPCCNHRLRRGLNLMKRYLPWIEKREETKGNLIMLRERAVKFRRLNVLSVFINPAFTLNLLFFVVI